MWSRCDVHSDLEPGTSLLASLRGELCGGMSGLLEFCVDWLLLSSLVSWRGYRISSFVLLGEGKVSRTGEHLSLSLLEETGRISLKT